MQSHQKTSIKVLITVTLISLSLKCHHVKPIRLAGFRNSPYGEQESVMAYGNDVRIYINAPDADEFHDNRSTNIVIYALPNGNTIEQTAGKTMRPGDDWHYDIQHIAAQTRYLREQKLGYNLVVAYLECSQKSWPAWKRANQDSGLVRISAIVDSLHSIFAAYNPFITLSGHSGGGSFVNGFIEGNPSIPVCIKRITFLDSNYGYNSEIGRKLKVWLESSKDNSLCVLAYNDSIALYNGKPVVSDTGGTWFRSKMMVKDLSSYIKLNFKENHQFIVYKSDENRVEVLLKKNPTREILHTQQVAFNGFINCMLSGTVLEEQGYQYYGQPVYRNYLQGIVPTFRQLTIPQRQSCAESASLLCERIKNLSFEEREKLIIEEISNGNFPDYLRSWATVEYAENDSRGIKHHIRFQVMPDYLSIGDDDDFCRIPMGPKSAQSIADTFGAVLPTPKLVDVIYANATIKLEPFPFKPIGDLNTKVERFYEHQRVIQSQLSSYNTLNGYLIAGHKKDIVTSLLILDPQRPDHVVIYGWHRPDGTPIQPETNIHVDWYVDYSHGARLINSEIFVDGFPVDIRDIWSDSVLYKLVSEEVLPGSLSYSERE